MRVWRRSAVLSGTCHRIPLISLVVSTWVMSLGLKSKSHEQGLEQTMLMSICFAVGAVGSAGKFCRQRALGKMFYTGFWDWVPWHERSRSVYSRFDETGEQYGHGRGRRRAKAVHDTAVPGIIP